MFLPLSVCEDRVFTCMFTLPSMQRPNPPRPVPSRWSVYVAPMEATTAPGAFNAKLKLIFSLALAVTFTSLPRRRLALDIPPVAFFIPGGSKCVCVYGFVHLCRQRCSFQHLSKKMHLGGLLSGGGGQHQVCGEACDFDWGINLKPPLMRHSDRKVGLLKLGEIKGRRGANAHIGS